MFSSLASHSVVRFAPDPAVEEEAEMPGVEDWKVTPLAFVERIFRRSTDGSNNHVNNADAAADKWEREVDEFFQQKLGQLSEDEINSSIPSLNSVPSIHDHLSDGQLVRFRCMVQDMFDPEFYPSVLEIRDLSTGLTRPSTAKYRDVVPLGPREEVLFESAAGKSGDRQGLYCVSIPGEAMWVAAEFGKSDSVAAHQQQQGTKRSLTEQEEDQMKEVGGDDDCSNKKAKMESGAVNSTPAAPVVAAAAAAKSSNNPLNFPIPGSKGRACIAKIYDTKAAFAVNDCVELIGIVSLEDPVSSPVDSMDSDEMREMFDHPEIMARSPPAKMVPRIHVIHHRKLEHLNPYLPRTLASVGGPLPGHCRAELHSLLTKLLLGDALAADYLICHLVAKIYLRREPMVLGKFSINIHGFPSTGASTTRRLATVLQLLLCKSHYLPLTVDNLNTLPFVPKKDYDSNRLVSGVLQLSENTHLILDETAMQEGQLGVEGMRNLTALGGLITWQKVDYDFSYHKLEFSNDVPCLVLSEGRSMLPSDCAIMLKPASATCSDATSDLSSGDLLERLRKYLTLARHLEFEVTDDVAKQVQEDFVAERMAGNAALTGDDLHGMLVMSRLLALSNGCNTLTPEVWQKVKRMEIERKSRVAHLPERS